MIRAALRHPISVLVAVCAIVLFSVLSLRTIPIDIFPKLDLPTVYIAQPYGGLSPAQMEGYVSYYYEYHLLYVNGIKSVESKSIQGATLIKCQFHPGTSMEQSLAEVVAQVNRSRAFMPPGTVPPFVMRFDASSVAVGQLVFSSPTRTLSEIADLALNKVRPMFSALPGVSAPPPFGSSQRTVVIRIAPDRLRAYGFSPDEVVQAISTANVITPAGNIRVGDQTLITPTNGVVDKISELERLPLRLGAGPTVLLRDLATVDNATDIATGYALINGKRAIYIPVTKRADASTWDVVQTLKAALPDMQAAIPDDIRISYEFDQSTYVANALRNLLVEALLGALLTGLMVFLFLQDRRGALVVVLTIPIALLTAVIALRLFGQTINIMTLGGLALAVGILVDEATVTIENIHKHLEQGGELRRSVWEAAREIAVPKLLILLCVLSVFVPSAFMTGMPKSLFMPLALAVGLAMVASFVLSQTLVPVLANYWKLAPHDPNSSRFGQGFARVQERYRRLLDRLFVKTRMVLVLYALLVAVTAWVGMSLIGTDVFPQAESGQFQLRLRLPTGTRLERTEVAMKRLLTVVDSAAGPGNVLISSAFVGVPPPNFPVNLIHLWSSGPHEGVALVRLKQDAPPMGMLKELIRSRVAQVLPEARISFEPADLVDKVISQGSPTPIEVAVLGLDLVQSRAIATRIRQRMDSLPILRDVQLGIPLDQPTLRIDVDRERAGQLGLTMLDVGRSLTAATSSSRYTTPNYWLDASSGVAYQVQVEVPQFKMNAPEEVGNIPLTAEGNSSRVRDVAALTPGVSVGEYDRLNQQRMVTITANTHDCDLGSALRAVEKIVAAEGELPKGSKVLLRGQAETLKQTQSELQAGLALAVVVIFLLLAAYFQRPGLALAVVAVAPAVVVGSLLALLLTGQSLNIQSYTGAIMAIGVSIANSVFLITAARSDHQAGADGPNAARGAARRRLRPILMTTLAMSAGMLPMALGLGEGGGQTAPLGIAVIGGLLCSTLATLLVLPLLFASITKRAYRSPSQLPQ